MLNFKNFNPQTSFKMTTDFAALYYESLDSPKALSCALLLKHKEYEQLIRMSISPNDYNSPEDFSNDYLAVSLLKKYEGFPSMRDDPAAIALEKFLDAESLCAEVNRTSTFDTSDITSRKLYHAKLKFLVARKISQVLGDVPDILDLDLRFGPGATSACTGTAVNPADKLHAKPECTYELIAPLKRLLNHDSVLRNAIFDLPIDATVCTPLTKIKVVPGNKLTFVPKTALCSRAICVEPNLNTLFQKGIGSFIRKRLRRLGIDLSNQPKKHKIFTQMGSLTGLYSTIDLSSASDTISTSIVWDLLPQPWIDLLETCRSPFTYQPEKGEWVQNEKFSSMGNGYTFELETLIFASITSVIEDLYKDERFDPSFKDKNHPHSLDWSVFGDDIICHRKIADELIEALKLFGFIINEEKSFSTTFFRESCGNDYFDGVSVRPYFHKKTDQKYSWYLYRAKWSV